MSNHGWDQAKDITLISNHLNFSYMSLSKQRLTPHDGHVQIVNKMSDGKPGAMKVLLQILTKGNQIDPDSGPMAGVHLVMTMDKIGIFGAKIWILYSDICEKSLPCTVAVIRAVQLGLLPESTLLEACSREDSSGRSIISVVDICLQVSNELPNFNLRLA